MKILVYRWKAYNYEDIIENFRMLGHQVDVLEYHLTNYDEDAEFSERLEMQLQQQKACGRPYDFVFSVNYFALIAEVCEIQKTRYVLWTCDNPLISMYHRSVFSPYNVIFTFDKSNELEFRAMGVPEIYHLPLAVDAKRMQHMISQTPQWKRQAYHSPVSFVGSLYERNSFDKLEHVLSEYERGYLDALIEAQSDLYGEHLVERLLTADFMSGIAEKFALQKSEGSFSDLSLIFETTVLGFKIAQYQRKRALLNLSKTNPVTVYSNSDTSDLLQIHYGGSVDYWTEMPVVFHETDINLNFTIPNIKTGMPLRMWDILGAGGFMLTNYQWETGQILERNKDYVEFSCEEEMLEKVSYYRIHETERKQIAAHGLETVKGRHTYEHRLQEMLQRL